MRYLFLTLALALSSYGGAGAHLLTRTRAAADTTSFITTWSITDNGTAAQRTITLPTSSTGYGVAESLSIDWGDGNIDTAQTDSDLPFTHEYASGSGTTTPTITITGTFPRWYFNNGGDKLKITGVTQWGDVGTTSAFKAFQGCTNLVSIATLAWETSSGLATDWQYVFYGCTSLTSLPTGLLDNNTATTDFTLTFYNCNSLTALPSDLFDTLTSVTEFGQTFQNCTGLTTLPAGLFDANTLVTSFSSTFMACTGLTTIPAGLFDNNTAVTTFYRVFYTDTALTAIPTDLFRYNTSVTSFDQSFLGCSSLTTVNAGAFQYNTSVTTYGSCFDGCAALVNFGSTIGATAATIFGNFLDNSTINSTDYNAIMTDFEAQRVGAGIQSGVTFDGGSSIATGQGATDRQSIITNESWTIQDSTP